MDQDSAGPQGTNLLSLFMLLMSEDIELLGITTVSGDQWVRQETWFALYAVELADREDVPVVMGTGKPLLQNRVEQEARERLFGSHPSWHGSFNPDAPAPTETWEPPGGFPKTRPKPGHAADFIVETIRAHPGEVVLLCLGPLTNVALAVRLAPDIVPLTKAIYIMGGSVLGGWELNWWWDPEAAAIVLREPWPSVVLTPGEIGNEAWSSPELMAPIAASGGRLSEYVRTLYLEYESPDRNTPWSMMWDEVSVASLIEPEVITKWETLYVDVEIDHGPGYGRSLIWKPPQDLGFFLPYSGPEPIDADAWASHLEPPFNRHPARVQVEVDTERFDELFIELMSRR